MPQIWVFGNLLQEIENFRENTNIQFNVDSNLNQEINSLKEQLSSKNQIIEKYELTIYNNQTLVKKLQNDIYIKEQELISVQNKLINRTEELNRIKSSNKMNKEINKDEGLHFALLFRSVDQKILYPISCKSNDIVVKVEQQLYDEFPQYKEFNTYLTCNGNVIKRFKTIEENGIKNGNTIIVGVCGED